MLSRYISVPMVHQSLDLVEIQSLDLSEVIAYKAREAYQHIHAPVLVEDVSLRFLALGKLPGPLIKWFLGELGTSGLCRLLDTASERSALAEVQFGLYDGHTLQTFSGSRQGSIALSPRGERGFGWDAIFVPAGSQKTWAEMTDEEVQATSMRNVALQQLEASLNGK